MAFARQAIPRAARTSLPAASASADGSSQRAALPASGQPSGSTRRFRTIQVCPKDLAHA
jgi:hypothetical protein